jgi:hypothetical protein
VKAGKFSEVESLGASRIHVFDILVKAGKFSEVESLGASRIHANTLSFT